MMLTTNLLLTAKAAVCARSPKPEIWTVWGHPNKMAPLPGLSRLFLSLQGLLFLFGIILPVDSGILKLHVVALAARPQAAAQSLPGLSFLLCHTFYRALRIPSRILFQSTSEFRSFKLLLQTGTVSSLLQ